MQTLAKLNVPLKLCWAGLRTFKLKVFLLWGLILLLLLLSSETSPLIHRWESAVNNCGFCPGKCAKKVVSDSPGLVDFTIGLVNSVFNLPDKQVMFLRNLNNRRTVKSILLVKKFLGLVEMTYGLVKLVLARSSLPKWQAVKMIFFAPCLVQHEFNS